MKNIMRLLLLALLWTACKKAELPPDDFGSPVFEVQFSAAGEADAVIAGVDNFYLFTRYDIADQQVVCAGSFANVNCPDGDCPGSLTFEFKSILSDIFSPDTILHLGEYDFLNPDTLGNIVFRTTFNVLPNNGYSNFIWEIDDSLAGTGASLVRDFPDEQPRLVQLTAQKTGLTSRVTRTISLTNPGALFPAVGINAQLFGNGFQLLAESSGAPVVSHFWNTGDTSQAIFQDSLIVGLPYDVTVTDGFSNTASARLANLSPDDVPVRTAGFSYTVQQIFNPAQPGEVAIQWVDTQGEVWRSDRGQQPAASSFFVETSTTYEVNEKGEKTRKMQVIFNCLLFNAAGESIDFVGEGVIAVAHP